MTFESSVQRFRMENNFCSSNIFLYFLLVLGDMSKNCRGTFFKNIIVQKCNKNETFYLSNFNSFKIFKEVQ